MSKEAPKDVVGPRWSSSDKEIVRYTAATTGYILEWFKLANKLDVLAREPDGAYEIQDDLKEIPTWARESYERAQASPGVETHDPQPKCDTWLKF